MWFHFRYNEGDLTVWQTVLRWSNAEFTHRWCHSWCTSRVALINDDHCRSEITVYLNVYIEFSDWVTDLFNIQLMSVYHRGHSTNRANFRCEKYSTPTLMLSECRTTLVHKRLCVIHDSSTIIIHRSVYLLLLRHSWDRFPFWIWIIWFLTFLMPNYEVIYTRIGVKQTCNMLMIFLIYWSGFKCSLWGTFKSF